MATERAHRWHRLISTEEARFELGDEVQVRVEVLALGAGRYELRLLRHQMFDLQPLGHDGLATEELWCDWSSMVTAPTTFRAASPRAATLHARKVVEKRFAELRGG